jgi:hypothetical protein
MSEDLTVSIGLIVLGAIVGTLISLLVTYYSNVPYLKIVSVSPPISLTLLAPQGMGMFYGLVAFRVKIKNEKRLGIFGDVAKGCICEVRYDAASLDKFRLPWIYGNQQEMTMDIHSNNDDEIDFCARCLVPGAPFNAGDIIAPINGNYDNAQKIGDITHQISGMMKITSENKGYLEKRFNITPVNDSLQITFSNDAS